MRTTFSEIIRFQKNKKLKNVYDLEFDNIPDLKNNSSVECHVILYPYSRNITRDDYSFNPFEEYIKDLTKNKRSAYIPIRKPGKYIFGIFLGVLISLIIFNHDPEILFSVESIVGIFAAYFIGKDLWEDIDEMLVNLTQNSNLRYQNPYYQYKLDKNNTMTQYNYFAKKNRYGKEVVLPSKMEFIEEHNSSTARMYFNGEDIKRTGNIAHILSIHINPKRIATFEKEGYLLGTKISLNKKILGINFGTDMFQSLSEKKKGCLDSNGKWLDNTVYYRKTLTIGRIKIFLKKGFITNMNMIA
ncbi:MAG: hypothetical protein ACP5N1_04840 [Candidatus Woesearchaeota archaeon]